MTWDVLGIGAVAVDDLVYVPHYPEPDTKVLVERQERQGGGLTGTALVAAARQGVSAAYSGLLGTDELSRYTISELAQERVDCSAIVVQPGNGPVHSTIIVDNANGQRTILHSHALVHEQAQEMVGETLVARCRVLFVDYTMPANALTACLAARKLGVPTVGDLEGDATPQTLALVPLIDHLIINFAFARLLSGKAEPELVVRALADKTRTCLVVTDGPRGGWWQTAGGPIQHYDAYPVPVVDTTGCGDVFHGVYAAYLARGEAPTGCVLKANAAAALKATRPGGRAGCPTNKELEQFLQNNTI